MDAEQRAHQEDRAEEEALEQDGAAGPPPALDFPVIGIGASAGGLRAYETFFDEMHEATGMAFVLVQHLDPHHQSELAELLQNHTRMPVLQVEDGTHVEPNHVYVIPPGTSLSIEGGVLRLSDPVKRRGHRAPIDLFFRSLAEDQGERAVAVVLSGTGSDGTLGLKAVKERAGITMAQDPDDAEYDGMPRSAIATGLVDVALPAGELARKLVEYSRNADRIRLPKEPDAL
ncbi:MAG: chemotaxis protein CheB, partial [Rhodothermales bacterium]|nr:chemotaxis protein CheB [Rhodothermales bacterium]